MDSNKFKELLDELDGNSLETLKEKNARYSQNGDCLHNFRSGAEVLGGTPAQACWGYMTKHLVALRDMVERNDFSNREDFLEKCQDTINYIRFLWCIGNDSECMLKDSYKANIIFRTRTDAEHVLDQLQDIINKYGVVTIADMYDISGLPVKDIFRQYGWIDIRTADVIHCTYGYFLNMPKALPII